MSYMTPKEKAKELVDKFIEHTRVYHEVLGWEDYIDSAKQCALVAADEIEEVSQDDSHFKHTEFSQTHPNYKSYWKLVKTEIEKI